MGRLFSLALVSCIVFGPLGWADHKSGNPSPSAPNGRGDRTIVGPKASCEEYREKFFSADRTQLPEPRPKPGGKPAGHSNMGDHYTEGRRRQAKLWGETGKVHFPTSTKNKQAQAFFEQGVGLLHGYDHAEAERSFRQALTLDPDMIVAYWGLIASIEDPKRRKGFLEEAKKKLPELEKAGKVTAREKLWLKAAETLATREQLPNAFLPADPNYIKALEAILAAHPKDLEAKAFLGHELMAQARNMDPEGGEAVLPRDAAEMVRSEKARKAKDIAAAEKVDKLFKEVLAVEPRHPVHHYRVHLWDLLDGNRALDSAKVLGASASNVGHMWHMPGHTYSDTGKYREAVANQEASARVDNRRLEELNLLPHEHGDYAHNHGWLVENMGHVGMAHRAIEMAKHMIDLPMKGGLGAPVEGFYRLVETLKQFGMWEQAIELADGPYLATSDDRMETEKQMLLGLAYANLGKTKELQGSIEALECLLSLQMAPKEAPGGKNALFGSFPKLGGEPSEENGGEPATEGATPPDNVGFVAESDSSSRLYAEHLKVWSKRLDKKDDEALALFRSRERGVNGQSRMPLEEARLAAALGRKDEAKQILRDHLEGRPGLKAAPLAELTRLQLESGETQTAVDNFKKLDELMASADARDREHRPFRALTANQKLAGQGTLGRGLPLWKEDADHPAMGALGPLYWTPKEAAPIEVTDVKGKKISLADYRGKPVMVVFNLGTECPHCNLQLKALMEKTADYKKAGIEVLVVTNESADKLKVSVDALENPIEKKGEKRAIPFRMGIDPSLKSFRANHVFDDFENMPQHGMYLIDASGRLRWREVGHEPIMDLDGVLTESRRLLRK